MSEMRSGEEAEEDLSSDHDDESEPDQEWEPPGKKVKAVQTPRFLRPPRCNLERKKGGFFKTK